MCVCVPAPTLIVASLVGMTWLLAALFHAVAVIHPPDALKKTVDFIRIADGAEVSTCRCTRSTYVIIQSAAGNRVAF